MTALGEMAAWIPHASGFAGYATRFCDPALGFALGWTYWCKYVITTPNQLTATALILQEWKSRDEVPMMPSWHGSLEPYSNHRHAQSVNGCGTSHIVLGRRRQSQSGCLDRSFLSRHYRHQLLRYQVLR